MSVCIIAAPPHPVAPVYLRAPPFVRGPEVCPPPVTPLSLIFMPRQDDASRLLEFTGPTRPAGRRVTAGREPGERSGRSRGSPGKRLIFQGNTWRDISACIRSAGVALAKLLLSTVSRRDEPSNFLLSSPRQRPSFDRSRSYPRSLARSKLLSAARNESAARLVRSLHSDGRRRVSRRFAYVSGILAAR